MLPRAQKMKRAILDDITPVKQALEKKKALVAAGLGRKLSEADMKPLVEEPYPDMHSNAVVLLVSCSCDYYNLRICSRSSRTSRMWQSLYVQLHERLRQLTSPPRPRLRRKEPRKSDDHFGHKIYMHSETECASCVATVREPSHALTKVPVVCLSSLRVTTGLGLQSY